MDRSNIVVDGIRSVRESLRALASGAGWWAALGVLILAAGPAQAQLPYWHDADTEWWEPADWFDEGYDDYAEWGDDDYGYEDGYGHDLGYDGYDDDWGYDYDLGEYGYDDDSWGYDNDLFDRNYGIYDDGSILGVQDYDYGDYGYDLYDYYTDDWYDGGEFDGWYENE